MLEYDLYLRADARRFVRQLADHGVRLGADRIGWTVDGSARDAGLDDIADIHLTRGGGILAGGGSFLPWMRMIAQRRSPYASVCRLTFRDGGVLKVFDADTNGLADPARSAAYSEFVVRLHEQLAARGSRTVAFIAGYKPLHYQLLLFLLGLLGLMEAAALVIMLTGGGHVRHGLVTVGGAIWLVFQLRMTLQNAPRRYDPADVPADLLPAWVARADPPRRMVQQNLAQEPAPAMVSRGEAWPEFARPSRAPAFSDRVRARYGLWLFAAAVGAAVIAFVFVAGISDSPVMFAPGQAQHSLAALEAHAGVLRIRKLEVTPTALTLLVEAPDNHVDSHGLMSRLETWTATHATLFSGWREWDSVSGPHRADALPALEESLTKPFRLPPHDLPDLAQIAREALDHGKLPDAAVTGMRLINEDMINPISGADPLRWTVEIASPSENAEMSFGHDGRFAGADLAGTLRVRNLNLLDGGKDFDNVVGAIRTLLGAKPIAHIRITAKEIAIRTEDRQYIADLQGVTDRTPQFFLCHMTNDMTAGHFTLEQVDWGLLWGVQQGARNAASLPQAEITAVVVSAPQPAMPGAAAPPQWEAEVRGGGRLVRVAFDARASLIGVRPWDDRHYCD